MSERGQIDRSRGGQGTLAMGPARECDGNDQTLREPLLRHVLAVEGKEERLVFVQGEPCDPLSVGRRGALHVDGRGVLPVHAFVHFDGRSLHVCSTAVDDAVLAEDGHALPRRWSELVPPCRLRMGSAWLTFAVERRDFAVGSGTRRRVAPTRERVAPVAATDLPTRVVSSRRVAVRPLEGNEITRVDHGLGAGAACAVSPPSGARAACPTPAPFEGASAVRILPIIHARAQVEGRASLRSPPRVRGVAAAILIGVALTVAIVSLRHPPPHAVASSAAARSPAPRLAETVVAVPEPSGAIAFPLRPAYPAGVGARPGP